MKPNSSKQVHTMPPIKYIFLLTTALAWPSFSATVYSGTFDYKKLQDPIAYFKKKGIEEIADFCKIRATSSLDISMCAHHEYKTIEITLAMKLKNARATTSKNDALLKKISEPTTLVFFNKAQSNWEQFRDNSCYFSSYSAGPRSLKFSDFFECMSRATLIRIEDLDKQFNK